MRRVGLTLLALAIAALNHHAEAACKKGQVAVKGKTALRRGPGLNYPVNTMIEKTDCWKMLERSTDDQWVMIEGGKDVIGWVPASALDEDDRAKIVTKEEPPKKGPVGSGQDRGYVVSRVAATLLARPDVNAESRRVLPAGSKLLALSVTSNGNYVEVRDDRGETGWVAARGLADEGAVLPTLPRLDTGVSNVETKPEDLKHTSDVKPDLRPNPQLTSNPELVKKEQGDLSATTEPAPQTLRGQEFSIELCALAALPSHGLDSNGAAAIRRYAINAFATGAHLEARLDGVGPMRFRIPYDFILLTGLALERDRDKSVGGQQHDARLLAGHPFQLGSVRLVPEMGYYFALFTMRPSFEGSNEVQFASSHSHALIAGAQAKIDFTDFFYVDLEGSALVGTTVEYPIDLGGSKLTFGARGGVALGLEVGGGASVVGRWGIIWRKSPFSGESTTDPSITRASLTHIENTFGVGLAFTM